MCGIALLLERTDAAQHSAPPLFDDERLATDMEKRLRQRGPDHFGVLDRAVGHTKVTVDSSTSWRLRLCSAVLHLRGDALTPQPIEDADGNVLCWNGEVFGYRDALGRHVDMDHGNDTQWLSALLADESHATNDSDSDDSDSMTQRIVNALCRIRGPFAFVWFHAATQRLFFGHDRFGRRSLLVDSDAAELLTSLAASGPTETTTSQRVVADISTMQQLVLSSVALSRTSNESTTSTTPSIAEVPANGLFVLDLSNQQLAFHAYAPLPLLSPPPTVAASRTVVPVHDRYACGLPSLAVGDTSPLDRAAHGLLTALSNAVGVRVRTIPKNHNGDENHARVGVLFSGGLDSVVLAALTHFHVVDPLEPIDLLNVCFDAGSHFQSPDRQAALLSYRELCVLFPTRTWRFVRVDEHYARVLAEQHELMALLRPCDTHMDFNIGAAFWCLSQCQGSLLVPSQDNGVSDSTVDLNAFLTQRGVSHEQQRIEAALQALRLFVVDESTGFCPATKCRRKLKPGCPLGVCRLCCLKIQRLLTKLRGPDNAAHHDHSTREREGDDSSVVVNEHEKDASRRQLTALLPPTDNVDGRIDELCCVYDAHVSSVDTTMLCRVHRTRQDRSDAIDKASTASVAVDSATHEAEPSATQFYTTSARVLLVGIGADEQLGGYGRHKTAFTEGGADALERELAKDMARIWKRNLGRDDRCISAHGREARFPFLDEDVVAFIASLPLATVCDLAQPRGHGDKLVLRVAAAKLLGLTHCARLAKRAIQFGSRIAKHANVAAFGSNRQASGDAKIRTQHADDE